MIRRRLSSLVHHVVDYTRTRAWLQTQWPNPDVLYRRGGLYEVAAYLRQCWSPTITGEILTKYGADIHPDAWPVGPNITLHEFGDDFSNLHVGAFSHVGREVFLDLTDEIIIEDSVSLGMRAMVLTHLNLGEYPDKPTAKLIPKRNQPTILRRGCSVGAGCTILCGVEIGEHAVINAGVVVEEDVPPHTIVKSSRVHDDYEIPARFFRQLRRA